jgi:hypothetical protein
MEELIDNLVVAAKDSATLLEKERCFLLAIDTVKKHIITWPFDVDSRLWNQRSDRLINSLIDAFDMDAEELHE